MKSVGTGGTAVYSMKHTKFPTSGHLTLIILISCAVSSHGRVGGRKTTMEHLAAINAHYIDPGTPLEASRRGMCSGFKQTETLKGTWVRPRRWLFACMSMCTRRLRIIQSAKEHHKISMHMDDRSDACSVADLILAVCCIRCRTRIHCIGA